MLQPFNWLVGICLLASACAPAKAPEVELKSLDPAVARAVIQEAVVGSGAVPEAPETLVLAGGASITETLGIAGGYGIAFLSADEAQKLEKSLPAPGQGKANASLPLVRTQEGTVLLPLWADSYRYDVSEEHTATFVQARGKLKRDVRDFVIHWVLQNKGQ